MGYKRIFIICMCTMNIVFPLKSIAKDCTEIWGKGEFEETSQNSHSSINEEVTKYLEEKKRSETIKNMQHLVSERRIFIHDALAFIYNTLPLQTPLPNIKRTQIKREFSNEQDKIIFNATIDTDVELLLKIEETKLYQL